MNAKRYLLGESTEDERAAIERAYFSDEASVDAIAAEEDALIEDYLGGRLHEHDRSRFEQHYLASPVHRHRVETIRRLSGMGAGGRVEHGRSRAGRLRLNGWLAAAAVVVAAAGAAWMLIGRRPTTSVVLSAPSRTAGEATQAARAHVFAFSLAPGNLRGADDLPPLAVPANTDIVTLRLESTGRDLLPLNARAVVTTVGGDHVWQGEARRPADSQPGAIVDVPARRLGPDDYIVTLYAPDIAGREQERDRYFLRVRSH